MMKKVKMKYFTAVLMVFILLMSCQPGKKGMPTKETNHPEEYAKGELIVLFKNESTYKSTIEDLRKNEDVQLIDMLMISPPDAIIGHFKVPDGKEKEMIKIFQKHPEVKSAELNAIGSFGASSTNDLPNLIVTKIENGKDGYMTYLEDEKNGKYTMVVSIPNLGEKYVDLKIGDKIQVEGEYAESYPIQIFAKSIHILESSKEESKGYIKGKVESIQNGKDGYTAKIKTIEDDIYFVTISVPNLGRENAHQFRSVSIGETIEVKGEMWMMEDEKHITVRAIKPKDQ